MINFYINILKVSICNGIVFELFIVKYWVVYFLLKDVWNIFGLDEFVLLMKVWNMDVVSGRFFNILMELGRLVKIGLLLIFIIIWKSLVCICKMDILFKEKLKL